MIKSLPKYADMTNMLLEFLLAMSENYIAPGSSVGGALKADMKRGVQNALSTLLQKGVVHPMQFRECLITSPLVDGRLRDQMAKLTSAFFSPADQPTPAAMEAPNTHAAVTIPQAAPLVPPATQVAASVPSAAAALGVGTAPAPPTAPSPPTTQATEKVVEEHGPQGVNAPKVPLAQPKQAKMPPAPPAGSVSVGIEEEDDVLMNWTNAIKTTNVLGGSSTDQDNTPGLGGQKRKTPDTPTVLETPPIKRPKTSKSSTNVKEKDVSAVKALLADLPKAGLGASAAPQLVATVVKILASGLFEGDSTGMGLASDAANARSDVAKALVEVLAEDLMSNDAKNLLLTLEGVPDAKAPRYSSLLYSVFQLFFHSDAVVVASMPNLIHSMRDVEASVGWRLVCFCAQRASLVPVQLVAKTKSKPATSSATPSEEVDQQFLQQESDWFKAQLDKLQRLDEEEDKEKADDSMFQPYEALVETATGDALTARPSFLIADMKACAEASVPIFLELAPSVLRFLSDWAAEEKEFVKALCSCVTPAQLTSICHRVSVGEIPMIGKCLEEVIADSLDWPSISQYCLWQLINAEFFDQLDTLEGVLPTVLEKLDPGTHPEAIAGIQRLLQVLKPTRDLLDVLLRLPVRFSSLCVVVMIWWNTQTITTNNAGVVIPKDARESIRDYDYPYLVKASICGALKGMTTSTAKRNSPGFSSHSCLRHLTLLFFTLSKQTRDDFFTAAVKTEVGKYAKFFALEKDFAALVEYCEGGNGASAKKAGKKVGGKAKANPKEKDETGNGATSSSSRGSQKKRKREENDSEEAIDVEKNSNPRSPTKKKKKKRSSSSGSHDSDSLEDAQPSEPKVKAT